MLDIWKRISYNEGIVHLRAQTWWYLFGVSNAGNESVIVKRFSLVLTSASRFPLAKITELPTASENLFFFVLQTRRASL